MLCFHSLTVTFTSVAGNGHSHANEDRQRRSDFFNRMISEPSVFLDSFTYPDHSQASDTVSVDSSDSLETSYSACSPDNISRSERKHAGAHVCESGRRRVVYLERKLERGGRKIRSGDLLNCWSLRSFHHLYFFCCFSFRYAACHTNRSAYSPNLTTCFFLFSFSASTSNMAKIEEMERLLREAHAEKLRLLEHRVMGPSQTKLHVHMRAVL